jgi:hypothetical protein
MAAQRAAGEAPWGALKAQVSPSLAGPAKAALETLMQMMKSAAAAISISNFMAQVLLRPTRSPYARVDRSTKLMPRAGRWIGPFLAYFTGSSMSCNRPVVSVAEQEAYLFA